MRKSQKNQVSTSENANENTEIGAFAIASSTGASTLNEAILAKVAELGGIEVIERLLETQRRLQVQQFVDAAHDALMKAAAIDAKMTASWARRLRDEFRFRSERSEQTAAPIVVEGNVEQEA